MNASKGILIALGAVVIVAGALYLVWYADGEQTGETMDIPSSNSINPPSADQPATDK